MSESQDWTVGRLLIWTTDYLKQHGAASPRLDAEVLLAAARGCERIQLYTAFDEIADEATRAVFRDYVRRRAAGEPVAYLVGHREFFSLSFQVTRDVLIPRPETEHLVVECLDLLKQRPAGAEPPQIADGSSSGELAAGANPVPTPPQIADIGTGTGAIAISVAKHAPACRVTAIDISPAALEVARSNAQQHQVGQRIDFRLGDLLAEIPLDVRFDIIVSNPPYVSEPEWDQLPAEIKDYEPPLALVGGPTGTEIIARLIPQAAAHLRRAGWLLMEISPMTEAAVRQQLAQDGCFDSVQTVKDLAGLPRVIKAQRQ